MLTQTEKQEMQEVQETQEQNLLQGADGKEAIESAQDAQQSTERPQKKAAKKQQQQDDDSPEQKRIKSRLSRRHETRLFVIELLVCVAVVILLRVFVLTLAVVDGPSMQPTLFKDYRVLVLKTATWGGRYPNRHDVVVTKYPGRPGQNLIKRVVGLPGDTVEVVDGYAYVNGVRDEYFSSFSFSNMKAQVVKEGYIFIMGDNRGESLDSSSGVIGQIPLSEFEGQAIAVVWPLNKWQALGEKHMPPQPDPTPERNSESET